MRAVSRNTISVFLTPQFCHDESSNGFSRIYSILLYLIAVSLSFEVGDYDVFEIVRNTFDVIKAGKAIVA